MPFGRGRSLFTSKRDGVVARTLTAAAGSYAVTGTAASLASSGTSGFDIFVNIWQSNNFSSYGYDASLDVGHSRIFQMQHGPGVGAITLVTGEPLSYQGAASVNPYNGPPVGHILAFCRDYYLPNRLAPGRNILIIPCAEGGTGFSNNFWKVGDSLHEDTVVRVNAAMAAYPGSVIKACLCQGGEADSFALTQTQFKDYTVAEVADFRARWTNGTNVPFLFGQMSPKYWEMPLVSPNAPGFKTSSMLAIEAMATYVPNSVSISSLGLTTVNTDHDPGADFPDIYDDYNFIHFDAASQRGSVTQPNPLSKRYWAGYQTLVPNEEGWTVTKAKLGAGGWTMSATTDDTGATLVCNIDVHGAYRYDRTTDLWTNLTTNDRMPVAIQSRDKQFYAGPAICAVAPSDPTRLYLAQTVINVSSTDSYVLRSDDGGESWQNTSFTNTPLLFYGNSESTRNYQDQGAVDPFNPDVFMVSAITYDGSTSGGLYLTTNGGATWTNMLANGFPIGIPVSGAAVNSGIIFDRASLSGGRCLTIYACSWGHGLYKTTNGGTSWSLVSSAMSRVSGTSQNRLDNKLYFANGGSFTCGKVVAGTFSTFTCSGDAWTFAASTKVAGRVAAVTAGGWVHISQDAGVTWFGSTSGADSPPRISPQIGWHQSAVTSLDYYSLANAIIDPRDDRLIMCAGIGNWISEDPLPSAAAIWIPNMISRSRGIEDMVTNYILGIPGGEWAIAVWDQKTFVRTTDELAGEYPSVIDAPDWLNLAIDPCSGVDYASSDPTFLAIVIEGQSGNISGYRSGGVWSKFAALPAWAPRAQKGNGCIAASTPLNMVWQPSNTAFTDPGFDRIPYYTLDGGTSWLPIALPAPASNTTSGSGTGLSKANGAFYLKRKNVAACRVRANTFMLYIVADHATDGADNRGMYLTTNGGATWTRRYTNHIFSPGLDYWNGNLVSVPGKSGHWWWSPQAADGGIGGGISFSTNDATSWTQLTNVYEVHGYGFGAQAPGGSYPRLWLAGWVDGGTDADFGVWYSDNANTATPTFTKAVDGQCQNVRDQVVSVAGHPDTHEECLVGYPGVGTYLITLGDPTPDAPAAPVLASNLRLTPAPVAGDYVEIEVYTNIGLTTLHGYDIEVIGAGEETTYTFGGLPSRTSAVTYYWRSRTSGNTWSNTLTRVEP